MGKVIKIIKTIKLKNLLILVFLLIFNTYAWFIYATKVSSELSVHISSWNIEFSIGEEETVTNIMIEVERIYPGMEKFIEDVTVKNKGEIKAELEYKILSLKILDENYTVGENITDEEIKNKIQTEYPFKINIIKDDALLKDGTGDGLFSVTVDWPFESGNDELDTLWGNNAYEYYSVNPDQKSMLIEIELTAKQIGK